MYGWDGNTLAWESSPPQDEGDTGRTVHYLYEPGSFVPVAQALRKQAIRLLREPDWSDREYDFDQDPLWQQEIKPQPIDALAWYQCDRIGTPLELTGPDGEMAWTAQYKAWGEVREERSAWAKQNGLGNPIRFQGQYHDHETGLHYNRHRYYDPAVGRFISQDPIGFTGGLNLYQYAPNPTGWVDPLGLTPKSTCGLDNKIPVVEVSRSRYPESAKHIKDAQAAGHPSVLTIDREGAKDNRRESLKGIDTVPGHDRDEYPPAMFTEGGGGRFDSPYHVL
ncbi:RHS repeat-associated core domain-containing protein [Stenotrophomonas indicatrix]